MATRCAALIIKISHSPPSYGDGGTKNNTIPYENIVPKKRVGSKPARREKCRGFRYRGTCESGAWDRGFRRGAAKEKRPSAGDSGAPWFRGNAASESESPA